MSLNKPQQQPRSGTKDSDQSSRESPAIVNRGLESGQQQIGAVARSRPSSVETQRAHNPRGTPEQAKTPPKAVPGGSRLQPGPSRGLPPPQGTSFGRPRPGEPRMNRTQVSGANHPPRPGLPSAAGQRQPQASTATPRQVNKNSQGGPPRSNAGSQESQSNNNQARNGSVQARASNQSIPESTGPLRQKDTEDTKRINLNVERGGLGLVQQYPDPENLKETAEAEIETWEARTVEDDENSPKVNWLKDPHMLPAEVPRARILTYDWNADIVGKASADRFLGHADTLLNHLIINRKRNNRSHKPILFVASCFSGLLLAKALVRAADAYHPEKEKIHQLLDLTVGVIFLGTPFRGSWESGYKNACLWVDVAQQEDEPWSMELIQYLRPDSRRDGGGGPSPLNEVVQRFAEMVKAKQFTFPIVCFYETLATSRKSLFNGLPEDKKPNTKGCEVTVPEDSACLDGAHRIGLNVRHNMLHKHKSPDGYEFLMISSKIKDYSDAANQTLKQKSRAHNKFHATPASTMVKWIRSPEFYDQQSHHFNMHHPETDKWFLESPEFRAWETKQQATLFCPGVPGVGKTVLTSVVVESLSSKYLKDKKHDAALAFIYCSYERTKEQSCEELLRSILKQFLRQSGPLPEEVISFYNDHKDETILPKLEEVSAALRATVSSFRRVFIIIDALDECNEAERDLLLPQLFRLRDECQANLFFTTRPLPVIQTKFRGSITKVVRAQDRDIELYVRQQIDRKMRWALKESPKLKERIVSVVVKETDGMFILARLYMNLLKDQLRLHDVESTLESFRSSEIKETRKDPSSKVTDAYVATVDRINAKSESFRKLAKQVLMWMTFAQRPVSQAEVTHALAIHRMGQDTLDKKYFYPVDHMVTACLGLVEVEKSSDIMRLSHPTAQEYLRQYISNVDPHGSPGIFRPYSGQRVLSVQSPLEVHKEMCLVCITYLSLKQFQNMETSQLVKKSGQKDNMLGYAAVSWGRHAKLAWQTLDPSEKAFVLSFVESRKLANTYQVFLEQAKDLSYWRRFETDNQMDPATLPLSLGVELRLSQVVAELLKRPGYDPNSKDKRGVPILSRAARIGDLEIVKILLGKGASPFPNLPPPVPSLPIGRPTPLHQAAMEGQHAVVRYLLNLPTGRGGKEDLSVKKLRSQHAQWALFDVPIFGRAESVHKMLKVFRDAGFNRTITPENEKILQARIAMSDPEKRRTLRENGQFEHPFLPSAPRPEELPLPSFPSNPRCPER